jgi:signal transduction histidine kinase
MDERTLRVLLIEDDPEYAALLIDMLATSQDAQFVTQHAPNLTHGLRLLAGASYDIVLLDLQLPDSEGEDTYTRVYQRAPTVPIVITTSIDDKQKATAAVRYGVQDYLIKGKVNRGHLTRAIFYAIERQRAFQQAQHLAALEERQRLARDLHDSVSQTLFSATMIAETLLHLYGDLYGEQSPQLKQGLEDLHRLSRGARSELQTLLVELRPTALTETSLDRLLTMLTNALQSRTKASVSASVVRDCQLPAAVQVAFYRIAQEAFNNIIKHAQAQAITLTLQRNGDGVTMEVRDNGRGFSEQVTQGMGLKIMRERAASINAKLTIDPRPGVGTQIALEWHQLQEG